MLPAAEPWESQAQHELEGEVQRQQEPSPRDVAAALLASALELVEQGAESPRL